jgi:hypothetical protein
MLLLNDLKSIILQNLSIKNHLTTIRKQPTQIIRTFVPLNLCLCKLNLIIWL